MSSDISSRAADSPRRLAGVLVGGLIAGVLDITYACVYSSFYGRSPLWVLQSVASGLLGAKAFDGGIPTGALGLLLHFFIAVSAAGVYAAAAWRFPILREKAVASGAVFGVLFYLFMNFVVLPLSAFPLKISYRPPVLARGFLVHIFLIGIPIALAVRRFSVRRAEGREAAGAR